MNNQLHVLWVNEIADLVGGCEKYIYDTVQHLQQQGIRNTFLYSVDGWTSPKMTKVFDYAFPIVDIKRQLREIQPDILYIHRLDHDEWLQQFTQNHPRTIRFFHDHKLFCLREHKYKTLSQQTCTQSIGLGCYSCLGFINRSDNFLKIKLRTLREFRKKHRLNQQCQHFVVGSDYMANHVAAHGFAKERIHTIPLYAYPINKQNITRHANILLFVGQLLRGKGLDTLLYALSKCQTKPLLKIVGEGKQRAMFEELQQNLKLQDQVIFVGRTTQLAEYYQQATCVVIPSRTPETFGLVGVEAMSCGTPVIACDVGGISQWLQNDQTGILVPPNNPDALAQAIDKVLIESELAKKLGENAEIRYREHFQPQHHVEKLVDLFSRVSQKR